MTGRGWGRRLDRRRDRRAGAAACTGADPTTSTASRSARWSRSTGGVPVPCPITADSLPALRGRRRRHHRAGRRTSWSSRAAARVGRAGPDARRHAPEGRGRVPRHRRQARQADRVRPHRRHPGAGDARLPDVLSLERLPAAGAVPAAGGAPPARTACGRSRCARRIVSLSTARPAPVLHRPDRRDGAAVGAFKASGDITSMSQADGYVEIPAADRRYRGGRAGRGRPLRSRRAGLRAANGRAADALPPRPQWRPERAVPAHLFPSRRAHSSSSSSAVCRSKKGAVRPVRPAELRVAAIADRVRSFRRP